MTPGGRALKFYSSVRLDIRRVEQIKDGAEVVGSRTRVKVVKNKVSSPFKQAEFDIMYGRGISREGSLLDVGVELGLIKKSGAWFTYEGEQLGQGRENAKQFLRGDARAHDRDQRAHPVAAGRHRAPGGNDRRCDRGQRPRRRSRLTLPASVFFAGRVAVGRPGPLHVRASSSTGRARGRDRHRGGHDLDPGLPRLQGDGGAVGRGERGGVAERRALSTCR